MGYFNSLLLAIFVSSSLFAQKHDNVWFVGHDYYTDSSAVINFSSPIPTITPFERNMGMHRSSTSVCDSFGNLQFYTNGIFIHNALHQIMQNGDSLNPGTYANNNRAYGYVVPEGTIIIPHPKQAGKYYLFHQSYEQNLAFLGFGENLYYTLVDMNANSGLGRVEKKNQFLVSDSICYGQVEVVKHGNGRDWWLIQPMAASNGFYTFLITEDTIILISKQYIGNPNRIIKYDWKGQAVFTPNSSKYLRFDQKNDLDIFDFNRCTGALSNYLHIPVIDSIDNLPSSGLSCGVAISSSSQYAYVSSWLSIYQFDLWATDIAASKDTVAIWDGFSDVLQTTFSYLQLAPDNKIYIHAYSTRYLHVIDSPDLQGSSCGIQQHGVYIYHYNSQFIPNYPHYRTPPLAGSPCDTLTSIAEITTQEANIKIYPNPATTTITLESQQPMQRIVMYNALGQQIMNIPTKQQQIIELETSGLENGSYFISVWIGNKMITKQFMVLR